MAKKFGKVLLLTAAAASAVAAVYYYMQKKDAAQPIVEDEDFDDFDEDLDVDTFSTNYVSLTPGCSECSTDTQSECDECECEEGSQFTPLAEQVATAAESAAETVEETVEEFFDEEDADNE